MSAKVSGTTISLTRGDSLIIQISVNQEGKPYEVKPEGKIRFAMKKDLEDSEPLIMKPIDTQSLQLTIEPEETKKLDFGKYWYDIELTTEDGFVDTFIGTFKTPPAIAKNSSSVWSRWYKINGIGV